MLWKMRTSFEILKYVCELTDYSLQIILPLFKKILWCQVQNLVWLTYFPVCVSRIFKAALFNLGKKNAGLVHCFAIYQLELDKGDLKKDLS